MVDPLEALLADHDDRRYILDVHYRSTGGQTFSRSVAWAPKTWLGSRFAELHLYEFRWLVKEMRVEALRRTGTFDVCRLVWCGRQA